MVNTIPRIQEAEILEKLRSSKILFIQGSRKVGKQALLEKIISENGMSAEWHFCDQKETRKKNRIIE